LFAWVEADLSVGLTPKVKHLTSRFHGAGAATFDFLAHFLAHPQVYRLGG